MVIRMRHTRSHSANRRSHHALKGNTITKDKETGVPHLRHRVSKVTGKYRGKQVLSVVSRVTKKQAAEKPTAKKVATKKKATKKTAKKVVKKKTAQKPAKIS